MERMGNGEHLGAISSGERGVAKVSLTLKWKCRECMCAAGVFNILSPSCRCGVHCLTG